MKILIFGAGVIGSFYAKCFSLSGNEVSLLARGRRLEFLTREGLLYKDGSEVRKAPVKVLGSPDGSKYDYIFVCVREEQAESALKCVSEYDSQNIVTMINTLRPYVDWEEITGKGRLIPAFPGAGGTIEDGVLEAGCTPSFVQKTAFGEVSGDNSSERLKALGRLFRKSGIPCYAEKDMHSYQVSHLGLVVPLADAYYEAADPERAGHEVAVMRDCAAALKRNLSMLHSRGVLRPPKLFLITLLPVRLTSWILSILYNGSFGRIFMYPHAMKAVSEMKRLHDEIYAYLEIN